MKKVIFIFILVFLLSCKSATQDKRLLIEESTVSSIWIACKKKGYAPEIDNKWYKIGENEYSKILGAINFAGKGIYLDCVQKREYKKSLIVEKLKIILKQQDTINLSFLRGSYLWQDSMYKTSLDVGGYLYMDLCIKCFEKTLPLDSLWNNLIVKSGCLVGGQHVEKGRFGGDGCVMTSSPFWDGFFDRSKEELTPFLVDKFSSKRETALHVCPFFNALENELAVYCLHKIYLKNWYDFEGFKEFKNKEQSLDTDNYQTWLRVILEDKMKCKTLRGLWLEEMNEQKHNER